MIGSSRFDSTPPPPDGPQHRKTPGAWRRNLSLSFWAVVVMMCVVIVSAVASSSWSQLVALPFLGGLLVAVDRAHAHRTAVQELPPADGEQDWERRMADKSRHERAETVWGVVGLACIAGAIWSVYLLG